MKAKFFIPDTDTSKDVLIQELISNISDTIAQLCNRVFGYEGVQETFYQLEDDPCWTQRLYLSRWPVTLADIAGFTARNTATAALTKGAAWLVPDKNS